MTDQKEKSLVSLNRLDSLILEANKELEEILPEIEYLEECVIKLKELKERKHKLKSLIINLKSISPKDNVALQNSNQNVNTEDTSGTSSRLINVNKITMDINNERKIYIPEVALNDVRNYLRTKNNVNYEIYKAVVYNTGEASTEEIKHYLVKNNIRQPKSGKSFAEVPLKEISSRANYLVRKQLLITKSSGLFSTVFGWQEAE